MIVRAARTSSIAIDIAAPAGRARQVTSSGTERRQTPPPVDAPGTRPPVATAVLDGDGARAGGP
uniref:Uncharacterized protein n=1 Tax=uncultured Armatimonadetes bacterium TaxID=157466 RepID=A0A6J4K3W7_9BACT|nr:hypothetical protein AVDCRST_MAG63-4715 [uncultured Armatimonadetes bacterium]